MGRIFYKGYNVQYSLSLARLFYCYNGVRPESNNGEGDGHSRNMSIVAG